MRCKSSYKLVLKMNKDSYIIILSPAKTLNESVKYLNVKHSTPRFTEKTNQLVELLKQYSQRDLEALLGVSPKIAKLNLERYARWQPIHSDANSAPAILTYAGDVYEGLNVDDFSVDELLFSDQKIFILSGLYGVLRSLDLIQLYRLEMSTRLPINNRNSLYDFWGIDITDFLLAQVGNGFLVNMASQEYSKAVDHKPFGSRFITVEFRELRPDGLKVVPILSKRARGLMARFAVKNRVENVEQLKLFDYEGYIFSEPNSSETHWVFIR